MHTQLPQPEPQPVRIVSSDRVLQPAAAVWRISRSVTPLQTQTPLAATREPWEWFSFIPG